MNWRKRGLFFHLRSLLDDQKLLYQRKKHLILLKGYSLAKLQDQMDSLVDSTKSSIIY